VTSDQERKVRHYDANYNRFSTELYARVRREAFGEDIGQNSWLTVDEHDRFIEWLSPTDQSRVLDVACGSGLTTLRIAQRTGCSVVGIDIHESAIGEAQKASKLASLETRATFERADAAGRQPFGDASFDGLVCIDAINHLPNRQAVLAEWARMLRPGGVLVFTDPIVVTGPLTGEEMSIRSSIGFLLFVPPGTDEQLLREAGFEVTDIVDRTQNMAAIARRRREVRDLYALELRRIEGDSAFDAQQRFLEVAAHLAAERRLSRFAFRARKT